MTPSTTLPTAPGFYWWRKHPQAVYTMVEIRQFGSELSAYDVQTGLFSGHNLSVWADLARTDNRPIGEWVAIQLPWELPAAAANTSQPTPPTDPKKQHGECKPLLALIPPAAETAIAKALNLGASKYGVYNWRQHPVEIMTYLHAMKRHIGEVVDGKDIDNESSAHHLAHVAAGCCIVLDALHCGTLKDDRVLPPLINTPTPSQPAPLEPRPIVGQEQGHPSWPCRFSQYDCAWIPIQAEPHENQVTTTPHLNHEHPSNPRTQP